MRRLVVVALVGSAACAQSAAPATPATPAASPSPAEHDRAETFIAWLERKAQLSCTCANLRCMGRVSGGVTVWAMEHFGEVRFDDAQRQRMRTVVDRIERCEDDRFMAAERANARAIDVAIAELEELDAAMCACPDATCADGVASRLQTFRETHEHHDASAAQNAKANDTVRHLFECEARVRAARP